MNFIEIKLAFDNNSEKSLDSKEDLVNFYNGKNRLKEQLKKQNIRIMQK